MSYFAVDDNRMPKLFRILCCFVLLLVILLILGFILAKFVVFEEDPHVPKSSQTSGKGPADTENMENVPARDQLRYISTSDHITTVKYISKPNAFSTSIIPGEIPFLELELLTLPLHSQHS